MSRITDEMIDQIDLNNMKALSILKGATRAISYDDEEIDVGTMLEAALDYVSASNEILRSK